MGKKHSRGHKKAHWFRQLKLYLEMYGGCCRLCGRWFEHSSVDENGLRLAHIVPFSETGFGSRPYSCTLACRACDERMGANSFAGQVISLAEEPWVLWRPHRPLFTYG